MSLCRLMVSGIWRSVYVWGGDLGWISPLGARSLATRGGPADSFWTALMSLILRVSRLLKFSRPCFTSNLLVPCRLIPLVDLLISFLVQLLLQMSV